MPTHLHERRTQVALACAGASGQQQQDVLDIHCGTGQQILRWLGYAACTRLAHKRGKGFTGIPARTTARWRAFGGSAASARQGVLQSAWIARLLLCLCQQAR
jgi:hypothetical protein